MTNLNIIRVEVCFLVSIPLFVYYNKKFGHVYLRKSDHLQNILVNKYSRRFNPIASRISTAGLSAFSSSLLALPFSGYTRLHKAILLVLFFLKIYVTNWDFSLLTHCGGIFPLWRKKNFRVDWPIEASLLWISLFNFFLAPSMEIIQGCFSHGRK